MRSAQLPAQRLPIPIAGLLLLGSCTWFSGAEQRAPDQAAAATPSAPTPTDTGDVPNATATTPALAGYDPVLLCRGERFAGDARFAVTHEGHDYRFVDADSQATFLVEPARYAIQLGGACARMGELSGAGSAQRFVVHDGHIYTFASDGCRDGFVADPRRCLFAPAPAPGGTAANGVVDAVWQQAAAAHGATWQTICWATSRATKDTTVTRRVAFAASRALRIDTDYLQGDKVWRYARGVDGDSGWFVDEGTPRAMYAAARRAMRRELHRQPLVALRHDDGTRSLRGEAHEVAGVAVTEVLLWFDGEVVAFGVDAEHHVRTARYRGRGADLRYCEVVERFDDLVELGGVLLPTTVHTWHDGVEQPDLVEHRSGVQVDGGVPEHWFELPGA